ncbi:MFS transporter, partial [Halolamina salina]
MPPAAVARYYAYKATKAVELYRPIMYLYFASAGLSFFQITVLEAAYNVTTVLGEVPTGYLGDWLGRRNGLIVGTATIALTLLGLGLADRLARPFPAFLALYVCWSLGYTFRSGTEDAWLYDSLVGDDRSFSDLRGRGESFALAAGVVAA